MSLIIQSAATVSCCCSCSCSTPSFFFFCFTLLLLLPSGGDEWWSTRGTAFSTISGRLTCVDNDRQFQLIILVVCASNCGLFLLCVSWCVCEWPRQRLSSPCLMCTALVFSAHQVRACLFISDAVSAGAPCCFPVYLSNPNVCLYVCLCLCVRMNLRST